MSNPGNTGQRYKLRKLLKIEVDGCYIISHLECGHSIKAKWDDDPGQAQRVAERSQKDIGKRQRCSQC